MSQSQKSQSLEKLVGQVVDSRIWLHRLKQKIVEARSRGEPVWITIKWLLLRESGKSDTITLHSQIIYV